MNTKKILNIAAFALAVIGVLLKANHLMGGTIAMMLSGITMLASLFMFAVKDNTEAGLSDGLNYFFVGTLALYIVGIIFKLNHWPGAGIFVMVAYPLAFLFPIILMLQKSDFKVSKQYIITFFIFFMLLITRFPNNPISQYCGSDRCCNISEKTAAADSTHVEDK